MPYEQLTVRILNSLKDRIRDALSAKNLDNTGEAGMSLEVRGDELWGAEYLYYLDQGRGPGKFPPPSNIIAWVRSKLGIEDSEARQVAFLVGRKISKQGTEIWRNKAKGIQLDELIAETLDELDSEIGDEVKMEALTWL
jgi:hypothetical protein